MQFGYVGSGLPVQVKIRRLSISGRARVTLRPLWGRLPVAGALQLGLVRPPELRYDLSLGPMLATLLPLVKTWMDG